MSENDEKMPARVYVIAVGRAVTLAAVTIAVAEYLRPSKRMDRHRGLGVERPPKEELNDIQTIQTNHFIDAHRAEEYYQRARQLHKEDAGVGGLVNALHRSGKWYRKAMAAGHPEAHSTFGVFYLHIDRGAAIRIFKEGADMGIPAAMFNYALFGVLRSGEDISGHRTPKVKK